MIDGGKLRGASSHVNGLSTRRAVAVGHESALEGTAEEEIGPDTVRLAYGCHGKPGEPGRRPRQFAPFHLRLDWAPWFAALSRRLPRPWPREPVARRLAGERGFRHRLTTWRERRATGARWHREERGERLPPGAGPRG